MIRYLTRTGLVAGLALSLAGCEEGLGMGPGGTQTQVRLSRGSVASQSLASAAVASFNLAAAGPGAGGQGGGGPVALSNVASLKLAVTEVRAVPLQADTAQKAEWVTLKVANPTTLDLLTLPSSAENGLVLARGDLPSGTYRNLRIFVQSPVIVFKQDVRVGPFTYKAGEEHPVSIPGADQTGIKVPTGSFTVDEAGAEVRVVFDPAASLGKIIPAGPTGIKMIPVIGGKAEKNDREQD